ncbi:ABC transporter permease [Paenisporosarcina indica]|uniref:ABC transporter permease n=1 Tax=Paenisporosarcina indica TaxID=650093 RepID=UPI00094FA685|nr:FtsX-like permease family protein [Paenisporosarcina indica]
MSFKDQLDFIRQHLKKNKLRVFMTVLAATMGCAFLIVLASVGFGLHKTLTDEMLDTQLINEVQIYGKEDQSPVTADDQQKMREMENVNAVVSRSYLEGVTSITMDDRTGYGDVQLTNLEEEEKANLALSEGTMPTKPNEIVIGYHFAQNLLTEAEMNAQSDEEVSTGFTTSMIGKEISIELTPLNEENNEPKTWDFVVTGVAKAPSKDWMTDQRVLIDESYRTEFQLFTQPDVPVEESYISVYVYADGLQSVKGITESLKAEGYHVYSVTEEMETMDLFFTVLKAGLLFVGTIAVLISSIGIFNTMTMAVTERTREIGVMKAIGANPKLIQRLFLMESIWIGVIGTAIAVALSYAISYLANWLIPLIVMNIMEEDGMEDMGITISSIPWQLVVIASVISIGVAMVSGWRPARKATKIDVIQALRQEL